MPGGYNLRRIGAFFWSRIARQPFRSEVQKSVHKLKKPEKLGFLMGEVRLIVLIYSILGAIILSQQIFWQKKHTKFDHKDNFVPIKKHACNQYTKQSGVFLLIITILFSFISISRISLSEVNSFFSKSSIPIFVLQIRG